MLSLKPANEAESALLPRIPAVMDTAEPHPEEEIDEPTDCPCR
jgi:hypothetical protein